MSKTPYRIFVWDTQNDSSGSFLSIPYLELFGSQRIQYERLELLHSNHTDPISMLPSSCKNNQKHIRDVSLLQDVRFSQHCCCGFKSSAMWQYVAGHVVQVILKECSAFIFKGQTEQEKSNLLWVPKTWKMKALWSFNTLGTIHLMAQLHIQRTQIPNFTVNSTERCNKLRVREEWRCYQIGT